MVTDGAIDEYLADQLLVPLTFAPGISEIRTSKVTQHLITNAEIIQAFTNTNIKIIGELGDPGLVQIRPST